MKKQDIQIAKEPAVAYGNSVQQIVLNIENPQIIPSLKKVLSSIKGVSIVEPKNKKNELDLALEEAEQGKTTKWSSVDEYFKQMK